MKLLSEVAAFLGLNDSGPDQAVEGLQLDSREPQLGCVFIAYPGSHYDGRRYLAQAIRQGAIAVIAEQEGFDPTWLPDGATVLFVKGLVHQLPALGAWFYGYPSDKLEVIAVTGTNGKTSTVHFLSQVLSQKGMSCAELGTLGVGRWDQLQSTNGRTTPDPFTVQKHLTAVLEQGFDSVAIEASSHALDQSRLASTKVDIAIFTQLTQDHLDYHQTMAQYAQAKARLFAMPSVRHAILNGDCLYSAVMREAIQPHVNVLTYGRDAQADIRLLGVTDEAKGQRLQFQTPDGIGSVLCPLVGRFQIENVLAVIAVLSVKGWRVAEIESVIERLQSAPGRMQQVYCEPRVIVDYAHTPDALDKVLQTLRPIALGRLCVVFGCGGQRDREKRPLMAEVVMRYADQIVVTEDNSRDEDIEMIFADIQKGFTANAPVVQIVDRYEAIKTVLADAKPEDVVLLAGIGHERTIVSNGQTRPIHEVQWVQELMKERAC